jgi:hypothetical protein
MMACGRTQNDSLFIASLNPDSFCHAALSSVRLFTCSTSLHGCQLQKVSGLTRMGTRQATVCWRGHIDYNEPIL